MSAGGEAAIEASRAVLEQRRHLPRLFPGRKNNLVLVRRRALGLPGNGTGSSSIEASPVTSTWCALA
jgi:hypothetical protein